MTSRKSSPFVVDGPYTISIEREGPWSRFCERHEIRSVDDLRKHDLIPRFVDLDVLKRAVDKVMSPAFQAARAGRREQQAGRRSDGERSANRERVRPGEGPQLDRVTSAGGSAVRLSAVFNPGRISDFDDDDEVGGVVEELGRRIALPVRKSLAVKAVQLARVGGFAINAFQLDDDMEVRAPLVFDSTVSMCRVQDLRVRRGASIESQAPHFTLRARSFSGTWRSRGAAAPQPKAPDGDGGQKGPDGTPGRKADCRNMFQRDSIPTNGTAGVDGGAGTKGNDGRDGEDARGGFEAHLEILGSGIVVDTSGGDAAGGGHGGKGGEGGRGGTGGDGAGCEPSGMGGKGGNSGPGGNGGTGGKGGDAADIFIYYVSDQSAGQPPVLTSEAGKGGEGGKAGIGGVPGAAGAAGPPSKYGKARWDPGKPKGPGSIGANGEPGNPGSPGRRSTPHLEKVPMV